ncbi:uncharacterized protein [Blastocystis hominis]|uniref:Uncharacterized protein n=1 Tax=Blastocystis hominis TaxID=12968 RepID=D8LYL1_BLAHO|nr:uncharacterized protein [Blastocystis hominis]CBK20666.2 unnamed protein product [Blastocystis hominis]|eukprot:XP_012894714.1 uncharacterized protein [Blastocystis hominis]
MMKNKLKLSTNKSFSIENCRHLKMIEIGEGSFIDFGRFEITKCPKLDSLNIGSEKDSWNFFAASFIIQQLDSLKTIYLGDSAFRMSTETCIENLPQLRTITLKANALLGNNTDSSTLSLTDLPALESLVAEKNSFYFPRTIFFSNISKKAKITLPGAFKKVITNSVSNVPGSLQRMIRDAAEAQSALR